MKANDFLFPTELSVTPIKPRKILMIGACVSSVYIHFLREHCPGVEFTHYQFNNVSDLPDTSREELESYDFHFVAIPLRDTVTDRVIKFSDYNIPDMNSSIVDHALSNLYLMLEASLKYNEKYAIPTIVSNMTVPAVPAAASIDRRGGRFDFAELVRRINREIADYVSSRKSVYLLDIESIGNTMGKRYFADDAFGFYTHGAFWAPMNWEHDTSPQYNAPRGGRLDPLPRLEEFYGCQSDQMFGAVWRHMEWLYRIMHRLDQVKLVIFDLDDTLWRGQIAEDYMADMDWPVHHGWPLGIWEAIQHLRARGILVAVCSKNDPDLVRERWERAVHFGWVSLDDFTFVEIGWRPKAEAIASIIEAASLTPKSVVFVDDNPVERESVKAALPGVRVIGDNPYATRRILLWSAETQVPSLSDESVRRDSMIRNQQKREAERKSLNREEFLASLGASVVIARLKSDRSQHYARAFELLNKTNQFNTTGKRWTSVEMVSFFEKGGVLYVFGSKISTQIMVLSVSYVTMQENSFKSP